MITGRSVDESHQQPYLDEGMKLYLSGVNYIRIEKTQTYKKIQRVYQMSLFHHTYYIKNGRHSVLSSQKFIS